MGEYVHYDLMYIFHDTLKTMIKIKDSAQLRQTRRLNCQSITIKVFFSSIHKIIAAYHKYTSGEINGN